MKKRPTAAGRPGGTDGSDYAFRMTVDDRYKKAAQGKYQLRKYLTAQTAFQVLSGIFAALEAVNGDGVGFVKVSSCVFGGAAVVTGTVGLKSGASRLLKVYIFLTGVAVGLSLVPFATGAFFETVKGNWEHFSSTGDYARAALNVAEKGQEIIGIFVQMSGLSITTSLLQHLSRKRP